jgi:dTMP kinase
MAGRFIVFEGIDSDGLMEQTAEMARRLGREGLRAVRTCEPTDGPVGMQVRLVQNGRLRVDVLTLAALCLADRLDHLHRDRDGIMVELAEDHYVVCARYLLAAYAHQSKGISLTWLRQINQLCPWPDLTFFIDMPVDHALRRLVQREAYTPEIVERKRTELENIRHDYLNAIKRCEKYDEEVIIIDGSQSSETVHAACWERVVQLGL